MTRRDVEALLPLGRDVHASTARRRIDAPVVPYGRVGELAVGGRLSFAGPPDNLDELLDLVLDHDRDAVVGRGDLHDGGHELLGSFRIFRHATGDDVLAAAADGRRDGVSVHASILDEHADPAGHQVADRWLARNVALVETPAYGTRVREVAAAARKVTTMTEPEQAPAVLPGQPIPEPEQPELVPDEQHGDESTPEPDEQRQAEASAPGRMPAVPPRRTAAPRRNGASLAELTRLTAAAERREGGRDVMAALADITYTANPWITPPQYAGELWSGMPYQRQIVPLITTAALTGRKVTGWRWTVKPTVGDYLGDKTAVPSNAAATDDAEITAAILAGAHDIDRSFRDFGNDEFWTSYYQMMAMDYAIKTDGKAATGLLAGATVRPAATDVTAALVDALLFVGLQAPATFALVSSDVLVELLSFTTANLPALLSGGFGSSVDNPLGGLTIRTHASLPAGTLLVGTRAAATFYELPGSPVRIETVNIPLGGIDAAVHGYWALFINNPAGIAKCAVTVTP